MAGTADRNDGTPTPASNEIDTERLDTGITDAEVDRHLHQPFWVSENYADGFNGVRVAAGMLRLTGFSMQPDGRDINPVAVSRLVMTEMTGRRLMQQLADAFAELEEGTRSIGRKSRG